MCSTLSSAVEVRFEGSADGDRLSDVQELVSLISSNPSIEIKSVGTNTTPSGAKPDLSSTLTVISAVTGVAGLVMQAIAIWKQNKPKYSITILEANRTYTVEELSQKEYLATIRRLNSLPHNTPPKISIKKNDNS